MPLYSTRLGAKDRLRRQQAAARSARDLTLGGGAYQTVNPLLQPGAQAAQRQAIGLDTMLGRQMQLQSVEEARRQAAHDLNMKLGQQQFGALGAEETRKAGIHEFEYGRTPLGVNGQPGLVPAPAQQPQAGPGSAQQPQLGLATAPTAQKPIGLKAQWRTEGPEYAKNWQTQQAGLAPEERAEPWQTARGAFMREQKALGVAGTPQAAGLVGAPQTKGRQQIELERGGLESKARTELLEQQGKNVAAQRAFDAAKVELDPTAAAKGEVKPSKEMTPKQKRDLDIELRKTYKGKSVADYAKGGYKDVTLLEEMPEGLSEALKYAKDSNAFTPDTMLDAIEKGTTSGLELKRNLTPEQLGKAIPAMVSTASQLGYETEGWDKGPAEDEKDSVILAQWDERTKFKAQIKLVYADHPDWSPGQLVNEAMRRIGRPNYASIAIRRLGLGLGLGFFLATRLFGLLRRGGFDLVPASRELPAVRRYGEHFLDGACTLTDRRRHAAQRSNVLPRKVVSCIFAK